MGGAGGAATGMEGGPSSQAAMGSCTASSPSSSAPSPPTSSSQLGVLDIQVCACVLGLWLLLWFRA